MAIEHSFIIPLYNEEDNIIATVQTIERASQDISLNYEIIIIDDCSLDQSVSRVKAMLTERNNIILHCHKQNQGFAAAYRSGINLARGNSCQYIPSDNVISWEDLTRLLMASRSTPVVLQYCLNPRERKKLRNFISHNYTRILNKIHQRDIYYYNGLNIYPRSFLLENLDTSESFAFQAELALKAIKSFSYQQVPIHCKFKDDTSSALSLTNILRVAHFIINEARKELFKGVK